jgi:polysaccharide export outer membrane protein
MSTARNRGGTRGTPLRPRSPGAASRLAGTSDPSGSSKTSWLCANGRGAAPALAAGPEIPRKYAEKHAIAAGAGALACRGDSLAPSGCRTRRGRRRGTKGIDVKGSTVHHSLLAIVVAATLPATAAAQTPDAAAASDGTAAVSVTQDSEWTRWTSGRYRITPGDVIEIAFPFVPELTQTVTVQPDGYIPLKDLGDIRVQGRTVEQVKADVHEAYKDIVREPKFNITLKEFERPSFVVSGEVEKPNRYELRGATTLTQALAMAGGTKAGANKSQIVLYRRFDEEGVDAKKVNVARMLSEKDLSEDPLLRPGDTIVVPKSILGKVLPILDVVR